MSAARPLARRTAWAVAAALLAGSLASCSGSPGTEAGAGTTAASSSTASPPAPATGATETASSPSPSSTDRPEPTDVATDPPRGDSGPGSSDLYVVVSYAGLEPAGSAVEVAGFVPGLVEDGGRCVLVLGRAGQDDVTVEGDAVADVQTTSCGLLSVPVGQLSPGTWTARLDYRSDGSSASSDDVEVVVP
jgi:hypothetical protein